MIEGLFNVTCKIRRRDTETRDSFGDLDWSDGADIACAFVDRAGLVVQDSTGEDVVISGFFYLDGDVQETDIIIFEGFEYEIVSGGISYGEDLIAETTDHVRVAVARRRAATVREVTA